MPMRATSHVIRNLYKETSMLVQAGETFPMESMEAYRASAQRWLKDNTELSTRTIEQADWQEVYETFKA